MSISKSNHAGVAVCLALAVVAACSRPQPALSQNWNPETAASYLDQREDWWMRWDGAARDHGTFCISCHTSLPYALSRSALSAATGTDELPPQERRLLEDVSRRTRLWNEIGPYYSDEGNGKGKTLQSRGTESVLNALILSARDSRSGRVGEDTELAFANMWNTQLRDGPKDGAWPWLDFSLKPWEASESEYFGAAMAALAVSLAPDAYRARAAIGPNLERLNTYLARGYEEQSLLNRMAVLWAKSPAVAPERRSAVVDEILKKQRADGGWSVASLNRPRLRASPKGYLRSWVHKRGLVDQSSDGYATGFAVLVLRRAGTPVGNPAMLRALTWLATHQDPGGFWPARSLNASRDPASGIGHFMTDASTAFASLALATAAHDP